MFAAKEGDKAAPDPLVEEALSRLWHAAAPKDTLNALKTGPEGLAVPEVERRRELFGSNMLPQGKQGGLLSVYFRQFKSPLIYLLLAAAVVSLFIEEISDAVFIFAVVQINALIGASQEWKAASSAEALNSLIRNWAVVNRDGKRSRIDGIDLVPGDMVFLESGVLVPADMRLFSAQDLRADESLLTGESLPVEKDAAVVLPERTVLAERHNIVHAGSTILSGRATGIVIRTGQHTEIGKIAQTITVTVPPPAPLMVRLERFTRLVGLIVVGAVTLLAAALLFRGTGTADIFFVSVALAVSVIPEGLPVAISVALSVGAARMAKRNVIIRSLPAVEGLGACTLIASDKTGTLTCNELTVKLINLHGVGFFEVSGEGYHPEGKVSGPSGSADGAPDERLGQLATAAALCNEASFFMTEKGPQHVGDTVDVAFLVLAEKLGLDRESLAGRFPQVGMIPFEPSRRFAASFHRDGDGLIACVKGAPEKVLTMCGGIDEDAVAKEGDRLAKEGYRVLAIAMGPVSNATLNDKDGNGLLGLTFLGHIGLMDPLRPEVRGAVARCREAGVEVVMVTGDHPDTALTIARQLGIAEASDPVITGNDLAGLADDPAAMDEIVGGARVYARVEPVQKLSIVQAFVRDGHFVAVSGDGVNDAPALNAAHIGVAMGKGGTDVARGAADLILMDDNFASIVNGIEEGRIAYDNVRKVTYLLISTGAAELVLFLLSILTGLPLPLYAAQLLWLNLVTNGIQDVALAFEKGESDVLQRRPRPPKQAIFNRAMIEETVLSGLVIGVVSFLFFQGALESGMSEFQARNVLLLLLVLFENVHVFNCRSETVSAFRVPFASNRLLIVAVIVSQLVHIGAMFVPGLQDALRIEPVTFEVWLTVAPMALLVVVVMEIYKAARKYALNKARSD